MNRLDDIEQNIINVLSDIREYKQEYEEHKETIRKSEDALEGLDYDIQGAEQHLKELIAEATSWKED